MKFWGLESVHYLWLGGGEGWDDLIKSIYKRKLPPLHPPPREHIGKKLPHDTVGKFCSPPSPSDVLKTCLYVSVVLSQQL